MSPATTDTILNQGHAQPPTALLAIGLIAGAYLVGSIPFGYLIARAKGVNIFEHGSGNIGATNVGRVLGKRAGVTCFVLDVAKGLVPTLAVGAVLGALGRADPPLGVLLVWLGAMAATVVGHIASPWLGLRGGKGVATGLGAFLGLFPILTYPALAALGIWIVVLRIWRYVGLASVAAAFTLPLAALTGALTLPGWSLARLWPAVAIAAVLGALVVWRHRGNLARIAQGTEPKVSSRQATARRDHASP